MKSSHQTLPVSDRRIRTRIERCVRYVSNQTLTGLTEPDPFGFLKPNHIKKIGHKSITSGLWSRTKATTHTKRSYTHENHTNVNNHKTTPAVQPNEIKKATYEPTLINVDRSALLHHWCGLKKFEKMRESDCNDQICLKSKRTTNHPAKRIWDRENLHVPVNDDGPKGKATKEG